MAPTDTAVRPVKANGKAYTFGDIGSQDGTFGSASWPYLCRLPFATEQDEPARPLGILMLRPYAIVQQTKTFTQSIQELEWRSGFAFCHDA